MTTKVDLGPILQQQVLDTDQQQAQAIVNAAQSGAASTANQFVFFAAFDGTNNDLENQGHGQNTNIAQLWNQYRASIGPNNPNLGGQYYPGPGTKGTLTHSSWVHSAVTRQVIITAEKAYQDFAAQASIWLEDHAGGSVTAVLTSFSRGDASAAIFSQMLYERGLVGPNPPHTVLIPPGQVGVSAGVLFDPVTTEVSGNLAYAPNVQNVVDIRAQDEYRQLFKATDYSSQPGVTTVAMLGNHCDIGGSYDNGIAALALQAATTFFRNSGLPIGDVDPKRRFAGVSAIAIHSEEVDDMGHPQWDVYASFLSHDIKVPSPRLPDTRSVVVTASEQTSDGTTIQTLTLYNGKTVTNTKPAGA